MVKFFQIYGERCSGTNFLECAIKENFEIEHTSQYAWKHFFGHYQFKQTDDENETMFIGIVRNPITWIDSFYNAKHHIPKPNRKNIKGFLLNQFYSVYGDGSEIMEDRNMITKERYGNLFGMRRIKNNYLMNDMKNNVKNFTLIRYEDLRDNYDTVLNFIKNKFNLKRKNETEYIKILNYKGKQPNLYEKKPIMLIQNTINFIKKHIDIEQEKILGYNL